MSLSNHRHPPLLLLSWLLLTLAAQVYKLCPLFDHLDPIMQEMEGGRSSLRGDTARKINPSLQSIEKQLLPRVPHLSDDDSEEELPRLPPHITPRRIKRFFPGDTTRPGQAESYGEEAAPETEGSPTTTTSSARLSISDRRNCEPFPTQLRPSKYTDGCP